MFRGGRERVKLVEERKKEVLKMIIGISGHRNYRDRKNIRKWMVGIKKKYPKAVIVTGGALGADLIAAEESLAAGRLQREYGAALAAKRSFARKLHGDLRK